MTRDGPEGLRNIRLLLAYDGTGFSGWQRQKNRRTVQGELEDALRHMHGKEVRLTGSGRTDAGVHAAGQAANFYSGISMAAGRFVPALNSLLPPDVRVLDARETLPDFHSRFDASMRTYRYYFIPGRDALPHERRYAFPLRRRPRLDLLNAYGRELVGERDCSVFAGAGGAGASRSRYIRAAYFFVEGERLVFEISANAFLWKMVRSVGGTMLRCEAEGMSPACFAALAASRERRLAGPTLPPEGLWLWKIEFYRE
ncbi:MAG: tRNA pseudouridine(38-40) synthase TruA [Treponema sp.]|jgi:tRNA pseudouridine38-40 synthase|nr:tRNA pseudouridine(38-40) synthase TruA [Treponema sp.]